MLLYSLRHSTVLKINFYFYVLTYIVFLFYYYELLLCNIYFSGSILGRRVLRVRICSCPKRDKEKEEKKFSKQENPPPMGKKRKVENCKKNAPATILPTAGSTDVRLYSFTVVFIYIFWI